MLRVGDKVLIIRGMHQGETGTVTGRLEISGELAVDVDGCPGIYSLNPEACIKILSASGDVGNKKSKKIGVVV